MKTEEWNGHAIRFVEVNNEWWAVGIDIAKSLGYSNPSKAVIDHCKGVSKLGIHSKGGVQETKIISELDIYNIIFEAAKQSRNKEVQAKAEEFKRWVYEVIKTLRQSTGLEGFQIFRMLDKEHQKEAMSKLNKSLRKPIKVDFIKANTIANKAVSIKFGLPKMIKKAEMTPEMLQDRQALLEDTVELMSVKEKYGLNLSVKDEIYNSLDEKDKTA